MTDQGYAHITELVSLEGSQGQHNGQSDHSAGMGGVHVGRRGALSGAREVGRQSATCQSKQDVAAERLRHWMTVFQDRFTSSCRRTERINDEGAFGPRWPLR